MSIYTFEVNIERDPGAAQVQVLGEVDQQWAPRIREAFDVVLAWESEVYVLDLSGVTFFGSEGVEAVLSCIDAGVKQGKAVLVELSPIARKVFDLLGFWWVGYIYDGLALERAMAEAYEGFRSGDTDSEPRPRRAQARLEDIGFALRCQLDRMQRECKRIWIQSARIREAAKVMRSFR